MFCFGDCYVIVAGLFAGSASLRLANNAMFVVLSCHSIEVQGSLSRIEIVTFCGHVIRHRDILLARAVVVSSWPGGPGCTLPCFGFIGFYWVFVFSLSHAVLQLFASVYKTRQTIVPREVPQPLLISSCPAWAPSTASDGSRPKTTALP